MLPADVPDRLRCVSWFMDHPFCGADRGKVPQRARCGASLVGAHDRLRFTPASVKRGLPRNFRVVNGARRIRGSATLQKSISNAAKRTSNAVKRTSNAAKTASNGAKLTRNSGSRVVSVGHDSSTVPNLRVEARGGHGSQRFLNGSSKRFSGANDLVKRVNHLLEVRGGRADNALRRKLGPVARGDLGVVFEDREIVTVRWVAAMGLALEGCRHKGAPGCPLEASG